MSWNDKSWVRCCRECEGTGWVPAARRATIYDPYPEDRCDCGEDAGPICDVCGYQQVHDGYDCLACGTVAALGDREMPGFDPAALAQAMAVAVKARLGL